METPLNGHHLEKMEEDFTQQETLSKEESKESQPLNTICASKELKEQTIIEDKEKKEHIEIKEDIKNKEYIQNKEDIENKEDKQKNEHKEQQNDNQEKEDDKLKESKELEENEKINKTTETGLKEMNKEREPDKLSSDSQQDSNDKQDNAKLKPQELPQTNGNVMTEGKTRNGPPLKMESNRMKEYLRRAVKSASEYNRMINQERKDERRYSLDLQTYTFHYPIGLGIENRMLRKNLETGKSTKLGGKYPVSLLPGHYQDWYKNYTAQELKYMPVNTVMYGPVVEDPEMLPPVLTRFEDETFSESDAESELSSDHSCCCDENSCKKLKLDSTSNVDCDCEQSSSSSSEEEEDDGPPMLPMLMKPIKSMNGY